MHTGGTGGGAVHTGPGPHRGTRREERDARGIAWNGPPGTHVAVRRAGPFRDIHVRRLSLTKWEVPAILRQGESYKHGVESGSGKSRENTHSTAPFI